MGLCPTQCAAWDQVGNPIGGCNFGTRDRTVDRILFFSCKLALPSPFTAANVAPLFANKSIVASMPLSNVQWGEPEIATENLANCVPDYEKVVSREMTFEDNIAVVISDNPATSGVDETNEYWDYDFWQDKVDHRMLLRYGIVYCNGDVVIAKEPSGKPMEAALNAYLSAKDKTAGKGQVEMKVGKLKFNGDPLAFGAAKPDFNLNDFEIEL
jgi:hypothetical protein